MSKSAALTGNAHNTSRSVVPSGAYRNLHYRPALAADVETLGPRLRAADAGEVYAMSGLDPTAGLLASMQNAEQCWSAIADGNPEAMFGVARMPQRPGYGLIWLLGSGKAARFSRAFLQDGPRWLSHLSASYPMLGNFVSVRNRKAIRWLQWLKFNFLPPSEHLMRGGEQFQEFYMRNAGPPSEGPAHPRRMFCWLFVLLSVLAFPFVQRVEAAEPKTEEYPPRNELHEAIIGHAVRNGVTRPYRFPIRAALQDEQGNLGPDRPVGAAIHASIEEFRKRCRVDIRIVPFGEEYDLSIAVYYEYLRVLRETGSGTKAFQATIKPKPEWDHETRLGQARRAERSWLAAWPGNQYQFVDTSLHQDVYFELSKPTFSRVNDQRVRIGREWNHTTLQFPPYFYLASPRMPAEALEAMSAEGDLAKTIRNPSLPPDHHWFSTKAHAAVMFQLGFEKTGQGDDFDNMLCRLRNDPNLVLYLDPESFRKHARMVLYRYSLGN